MTMPIDSPVLAPPVEDAIAATLVAIRKKFADIDDSPDGFFLDRWGKALLDERPLVVISLVQEIEAHTWVLDMHMDEALHGKALFWQGTHAAADSLTLTYPLAKIREMANWLYRSVYAMPLDEDVAPWLPPEQRPGAEDAPDALPSTATTAV